MLSSGVALAGLVLLLSVPAPSWTNSEGVVWLPEEAIVRVQTPGYVSELASGSGALVEPGEVLIESADEELEMELELLKSRIHELTLLRQRNRVRDLVEADLVSKQLAALQDELATVEERYDGLTIRSAVGGRFVTPAPGDLPGRFVNRGELIGYVIPATTPTVRAVVSQDRIGLVRENTRDVRLLLANAPGNEIPARIVREVPEATTELPSLALSVIGGGEVAIDPESRDSARSYVSHFVFDLAPRGELDNSWYGQRVHVRFEHGLEPLSLQVYRRLRQLFLSRFNV